MDAPNEFGRFHRQIILPGFSTEAQQRLRNSHALVVGCGALGCASVDALVRAGVGRLTIVDRDTVEPTNLQRQSLFTDDDARAGVPKAEAAARRARAIDPNVAVRGWVDDFRSDNALSYSEGANIIIDGLDNFETRYLLNDLAITREIPYVYCGAVGYEGMTFAILPGVGPCLRCLFPEPPSAGSAPTCDRAGVFGPAVAVAAGFAMSRALRILAGVSQAHDRDLISFDLAHGAVRSTALDASARIIDCVACAQRKFEYLDGSRASQTTTLCGRNAVQVLPASAASVDLFALAARLVRHGAFTVGMGRLRGELPGERTHDGGCFELTVFEDGRAIVRGSTEASDARRIYSKYVGL
ncbi:MAG: thiazole biosynthesis adenylyltransferase ThiF [Phycisphaerales bacterium]|nr:thiazole biosynthesis adenylyltransferase ThiF [Phycisphaerales bacterium]